jgi:two-component system response regulator GlrR
MKKEIKRVTPEAIHQLLLQDWPGNVRELENTIEYAMAMTRSDEIAADDLLRSKRTAAEEPLKPLKEAKNAFERIYLINLLQACKGNVSEAAELAGKYRADFYGLLAKHNLDPADFRTPEQV